LEGKKKAKDWPETHWQVSRSPEKCAIWSEKENFQQKERVSSLGTLLLLQKKNKSFPSHCSDKRGKNKIQ
jgi:hypothetical protein